MKLRLRSVPALLASIFLLSSCNQLDDERIPAYAVNIDLSNPGVWISYGVAGVGDYNYFILTQRVPAGFPYTYNSATGYGGVLLVYGFDPSMGMPAPIAFDMSCPVERLPEVRVYIDPDSNDEAVCQECHSHYNVLDGIGAPVSGPAVKMKYALTPYSCYPVNNGGYIISRQYNY